MSKFLDKNEKAKRAMERFAEFAAQGYPLIKDEKAENASSLIDKNNKKQNRTNHEPEFSR